ncbi:protein CURVATURE THYLAKOID 1A, chloroplastic [Morus notabilis]|uniref:protein CURVATURE THYLAKOID 1A, chloroplastic n=1 Tax=Morus notabilis TaxID=981085 RepID=UPI000CED0A02|nr:protein CURVATURE THYLAKOID 1A, chloroplastic [Morus notabilis]
MAFYGKKIDQITFSTCEYASNGVPKMESNSSNINKFVRRDLLGESKAKQSANQSQTHSLADNNHLVVGRGVPKRTRKWQQRRRKRGGAPPVFRLSGQPPSRCSALPPLPPRLSSSALRLKPVSESRRPMQFQIRASSDETSSVDAGELFTDLKEKWDAVENKSTVLVYGGGAIVAVWLSAIIVGAINSVPLLPKILELVGLGYTGWFVYRYLLFKSSRKELATDIEALKKKIAGTE